MHSVLLARWTYTVRMQSAYRELMLKKIQRMHSVLLVLETNGPHMQRWTCVRITMGVRSA